MVLINVTKVVIHIVIQITGLIDQTPSKMVNFHEQRAITLEVEWAIWTIIKLEKDIMVLNNVTNFIKFLSKLLYKM